MAKKLFKVLISANTEIQTLVINPCFIPKMIIQDAQEIFAILLSYLPAIVLHNLEKTLYAT